MRTSGRRVITGALVSAAVAAGTLVAAPAAQAAECSWYNYPNSIDPGDCNTYVDGLWLTMKFNTDRQVYGYYGANRPVHLDRASQQHPGNGAWSRVAPGNRQTGSVYAGDQWWRICVQRTNGGWHCTGFHNQAART